MPLQPELCGPKFSIIPLELADGSCPSREFLESLSPSERRKIDTLFERLAYHGSISNTEHFKKLEGSEEIFEFKRHQIRLLCFFAPGRRVILAYGLRKKQPRFKASEIQRAEEYRAWFFERDRDG